MNKYSFIQLKILGYHSSTVDSFVELFPHPSWSAVLIVHLAGP